MDNLELTPRRPYLLRAFYDWLLDNDLTPHLVVDINLPGVEVPLEFAQDGQIVLNIAPRAVGNLELGDQYVSFNARFGGVPRQVMVPLAAVMAIYARENGAGTLFEPEPQYEQSTSLEEQEPRMSVIERDVSMADDQGQGDDDPAPPPKGGRPALRVVK